MEALLLLGFGIDVCWVSSGRRVQTAQSRYGTVRRKVLQTLKPEPSWILDPQEPSL